MAKSISVSNFGLTTAEILYRFPDYQDLLQTYIWQEYDVAPRFPKLIKFLDFWEHNLDGPLYKVTVAHKLLVSDHELRVIKGNFYWN